MGLRVSVLCHVTPFVPHSLLNSSFPRSAIRDIATGLLPRPRSLQAASDDVLSVEDINEEDVRVASEEVDAEVEALLTDERFVEVADREVDA
jgi:hypothetical protein